MAQSDEIPPEPAVKPSINEILDLLKPNGEIDQAEKAQAESMSKLGKLYQRVEKGLHGNRQAVSFVRKLDKMSADKRNDLIRTLEPLLVRRGYTLDDIDPQDLLERNTDGDSGAGNDDDGDDGDDGDESDGGSGDNGAGPLDTARAKIRGAGEEAALAAAAEVDKRLAQVGGPGRKRLSIVSTPEGNA